MIRACIYCVAVMLDLPYDALNANVLWFVIFVIISVTGYAEENTL